MFQHGGPWNGNFGLSTYIFLPFVFLLGFFLFRIKKLAWAFSHFFSAILFPFVVRTTNNSLSTDMFLESQEPTSVSALTPTLLTSNMSTSGASLTCNPLTKVILAVIGDTTKVWSSAAQLSA